MNNYQIDKIMKAIDSYRGTFSADTIPNDVGLCIVNTDTSCQPGEHWIAIYISSDRKHGEYFDSFGRPPDERFQRHLNKNCSNWTHNSKQLQSIASPFCGYYCIFYCVLRSRRIGMNAIVDSLTNDTGFNDIVVHAFICPLLCIK